jgi:hypothetical protein
MARKLALYLIILLTAGSAAMLAGRALIRHWDTELMEHKMARTTTGVVVDKKHAQFASDQTTYLNDEGKTRILQRGENGKGQFRVFYTIDNFNQVPGHAKTSLAAAEQERFGKFGPRYTIVFEKEFQDTPVGRHIEVTYRWASDREIEVISTQLGPGPPSK